MRNDSEHIPAHSTVSRNRGALADAQPHRPGLTVSQKLWLGFGVLLLLLLAGGIVIELSTRTIDANLKEITEIEEPESAAAFEMETNISDTGFAVIAYHHDRDPAYLARIEDNAADFAHFQQQYEDLTLQDENVAELSLSARIDEGFTEFSSLARDLIVLADLQFEKTGLFRQNLEQTAVFLSERTQSPIDPSDPDSNSKLHAIHEMEISANGVARELADYLRTHDTQYAQRAQEEREEFERFLTMYESLGLSSQERQWADGLHSVCVDCLALAQEIVDLDEAEELAIANLVQLQTDLDVLFADEIRAVAQAELAEAKADAERSVDFAQWALLALLIASLGGGGAAIIIGRGISKPLGKLATGVEHVGRGDLSYVIDVDSSDEIGGLAAAFNRMTTNLALITASRDELDKEIGERKQAEKALRESEAKYRNIFENVQDIFFQTDTGGIIVEISPSVEHFGYTRDALIGTSVLEIYEDPEQRAEVVNAILEHGEMSDFEIRLKAGDGRVLDISISAHARYDADGGRIGVEGTLRDISLRKQAENALEAALEAERARARHDTLTGVLNHGAIIEELRVQCSSAGQSPVVVAMLDLDGLKAINDTCGHQIGDKALVIVANVLSRDKAIVGRYGGDEFVVILPGADRSEAERYRDAVTAELLDAPLSDPETDAKIQVVASWGLAVFPEEAETIADLIHLSDSAMYAAKRQRPVEPGQLARRGPLGSDRAAEMVGALVPLLTSPGDLNDKLRLVSHQLSVGAGYDAVDFSMFAPTPGTPLAQNTFAQGPNGLIDAWNREQRDDGTEPHPIRLLFERSPRPVILNDPWNDELLLPPQREILRAAGLRSVLVAPLIWQDHVLGSLGVASKQEAAFAPADAQFLSAIATQVTAIMRMETVVVALQASSANLSQAHEETVLLLAAAAEAHDRTTGLHLQGVRDLTEALARELGYAEADATALGLASVLHDIGKIWVPDAILASPANLEANQWKIMKHHTIWGADFLEDHSGFGLAATVALHHHERWDGGGYPEGIAGDAIPEAATIVAAADALDAITHDRPYRAGRSVDEAVAEIAAYSGKQFNPKVVAALERLHQRNELPAVYPEVSDTEAAA